MKTYQQFMTEAKSEENFNKKEWMHLGFKKNSNWPGGETFVANGDLRKIARAKYKREGWTVQADGSNRIKWYKHPKQDWISVIEYDRGRTMVTSMKTPSYMKNEAFTKFDDKEYEAIEFPKTVLRKIAKLTKYNDHNQARIEVAKQLKKDGNRSGAGYMKTYQAFAKMQAASGDMSQSQQAQRMAFDKSMKTELERTYDNSDDVWMSL